MSIKLTDKIIRSIRLKAQGALKVLGVLCQGNHDFILANLSVSSVRNAAGTFHSSSITSALIVLLRVILYKESEELVVVKTTTGRK